MAAWMSGVGRLPCHECVANYERLAMPSRWNKNPGPLEPPCGKCRPEFHPLNAETAALYARVSGQWRYHPLSGQAISLPTTEVEAEMRLLRIPVTERVARLDNVRELAASVADCWAKEREKDDDGRAKN